MNRQEAVQSLTDPTKATKLKETLKILEQYPDLIHMPQLYYLRDFLNDMEAKLPELKKAKEQQMDIELGPEPTKPDESSLCDPNDPLLIPQEDTAPPPLGPFEPAVLSRQDLAHVDHLKHAATVAAHENRFEHALSLLSEAISHGHDMPMLYTRRAEVLLHMRRPVAAARDCSQALALNPNYARAFRTRGLAYRHLQDWEHAHLDLSQAQGIDYDEALDVVHRFVQDKWAQLYAMRHAYELKMEARASAIDAERTRREVAELGRIQQEGTAPVSSPGLSGIFENAKLREAAAQIDKHPETYLDYRGDPELGPLLTCLWDFNKRQSRRAGA